MGLVQGIKSLFGLKIDDTADSTHKKTTTKDTNHTFVEQDLLCKFVLQDNERIGETISIDSGHLIIKKDADKMYIPFSSIIKTTQECVVVGAFNRDEARKLAQEWQNRTTDTLKFDTSGMLIND
jgi:hypothetical protein